jgi:TRAP-type uncharacterized transport system substrate-binding protein
LQYLLQSTSTATLSQLNPPTARNQAAQAITQNKGETNMKKIILMVLTLLCTFTANALSADDKDFQGCTGNQVIIGTGLPTAPYSQMMQIPFAMAPGLICEYRGSTGGADNIQAMVERKIDAGIVQADVLSFMMNKEPMAAKKIRSLIALHSNYLHLFVLKNGYKEDRGTFKLKKQTVISNVRDLSGRKVAAFGSAPITADNINKKLRLNMKIIDVSSKEEGFAMLKKGEVAAFFALGGKPIPWVDKEVDGGITLAAVDAADVQKLGSPYSIGQLTYKKLGVLAKSTVAVRNELLVWDFSGQRAQQLLQVRAFFKDNLNDIKDSRGAHPAWQDVERNTLDEVSWERFQPAGSSSTAKSKKK